MFKNTPFFKLIDTIDTDSALPHTYIFLPPVTTSSVIESTATYLYTSFTHHTHNCTHCSPNLVVKNTNNGPIKKSDLCKTFAYKSHFWSRPHSLSPTLPLSLSDSRDFAICSIKIFTESGSLTNRSVQTFMKLNAKLRARKIL